MVDLKLAFREPTLADAAWAIPLLRSCHRRCCEYSYANMMMWRHYYHTQIAREGAFLMMRFQSETPIDMVPVGGETREGIRLLLGHAREEGHPLRLFGCNREDVEQIEHWFPGRFAFESHEADFDYLYRQEDLAGLAGKKYHSKRNHVAAFTKAHAWQYEPMTDRTIPEVLAMAEQWYAERPDAAGELAAEKTAVWEALRNHDKMDLSGGLIRTDEKVVAFTFGSPLNEDTFDVHVEKALSEYAGAYTVINQEFAKTLSGYTYINRENDVGVEGLRKAKQSYRPAIWLEKYLCVEQQS